MSKRYWWNGKQCRPWSDCSSRSLDLPVWKLRTITVLVVKISRFTAKKLQTNSYHKNTKNLDIQKSCCNHPKIQTRWFYCREMRPKDAEGLANNDPDQTAPLGTPPGVVWSGSALFAQTYLSENLESLWYIHTSVLNRLHKNIWRFTNNTISRSLLSCHRPYIPDLCPTGRSGARNFLGWPIKIKSSPELFFIARNFTKQIQFIFNFMGIFTNFHWIYASRVHISSKIGFYDVKYQNLRQIFSAAQIFFFWKMVTFDLLTCILYNNVIWKHQEPIPTPVRTDKGSETDMVGIRW